MAARATAAFGVADHYNEHCYLVAIAKGKASNVQVYEVFGRPPEAGEAKWAPETILRCEVPRSTWNSVSGELRAEFNRRLKAAKKKVGRWSAGETAVQRLLGKEMLVLLWTIEQENVTAEETAVAVRNWLGLKPEERWWLYTMTAATTGYAHQSGLGWRDALRSALCFGTRKDAFSLSSVVNRGSLSPRTNNLYKAPKKSSSAAKKPKKKTPARKKKQPELKLIDGGATRSAAKPTRRRKTKTAAAKPKVRVAES